MPTKKLDNSGAEEIESSIKEYPINLDGDRFANLVKSLPPTLTSPIDRYCAAAACVISECLRINVGDREIDPFFEFNSPAGEHSHYYTTRITLVGETLWKLRRCSGFQEFCRRLRARDMRSAFYEVLAARLMFAAGFEIVAKPEVYKKGEDFDFTAQRGSATINVEATALRPLQYSSNTVGHALEHKRKQLPNDAPSIIFCGCPPSWRGTPGLANSLRQDAQRLFARSQRVNAVVFVSETRADLPQSEDGASRGVLAIPHMAVEHQNPRVLTDLAFLTDGSIDVAKRYNLAAGLDAAMDALRRNDAYYQWVDGLLSSAT